MFVSPWLLVLIMFPMIRPIIRPMIRKKYIVNNKTGQQLLLCGSRTDDRSPQQWQEEATKPVMTLSPAGYYGYYVAGICTYIKENYDTSNYIFSGASAGAWNALFMTLRTDPAFLKYILVRNDYKCLHIFDIEREMKTRILQHYTTHDFDLDRLYIGVTTLGKTSIHTGFENLEDAVDCCIASSHIPYVTSRSLLHFYRNQSTFDGGFSENPYVTLPETAALHVTPTMWGQNQNTRFNMMFQQGDIKALFQNGYRDTFLYGTSMLTKALGNKTQDGV